MNDADWRTWVAAFLLLVVCLGGAAAASAGRALARSWRPFAVAPLYMVLLAAAVGFLHYAIFGLSPIPIYDLADALADLPETPATALLRIAADLSGWAALTAILTGYAFFGYRLARRRQMIERYDWLFEPARLLGWRERTRLSAID